MKQKQKQKGKPKQKGNSGALVLAREVGEEIIIHPEGYDKIVIKLIEIRGKEVRLSIIAPKEIPVHRKEVYDIIHGGWINEDK